MQNKTKFLYVYVKGETILHYLYFTFVSYLKTLRIVRGYTYTREEKTLEKPKIIFLLPLNFKCWDFY